ncbi:MAG: DUF1638 domain-containing protein [Proteobacteria bacterium]|nr:DUF1638 domain-containing protein [Pseudomonadota bacterium]
MNSHRTIVIACAIVIDELLHILPKGMDYRILDVKLHVDTDKLRQTLQKSIDAEAGKYDSIILGYGLCSQAIIGVRASGCRLIAPRIDDCISMFMGSRAKYKAQHLSHPGTYYLTSGWVKEGDTPFSDYEYTVQRYGKKRADRVIGIMLANYKRLALINTGQHDIDENRVYAKSTAEQFGLMYEELKGSRRLLMKLLKGPWDEEFVVIESGDTFKYEHFM